MIHPQVDDKIMLPKNKQENSILSVLFLLNVDFFLL